MKRRLLPILMTLVLVCALPIWAAFVTSGDVTNPLVCTADAAEPSVPVKVSTADDLQSNIDAGNSVKLTKNIDINTALNVTSTLTIDLNGYTLRMTGNRSVLCVYNGATLTIQDSSAAKSGTITGGNAEDGDGGGVCVEAYATLEMTGGCITGCRAEDGGGVYIDNNATLKMTGGCITDCHASYGGGIYSYGNLYMGGTAKIEKCTSNGGSYDAIWNKGGDMYADGGTVDGTVNNQGTIKHSEGAVDVTVFNGAVYNQQAGTIEAGMYNGTVENNGTISGGTFCGGVTIRKGSWVWERTGSISGGTFYSSIVNEAGPERVTGVTFAVTFDRGDGTKTEPTPVKYNDLVPKPTAPTKSGYTFTGWEDANGAYDFNTPVTGPLTLTAKWEKVPSSGGYYYYAPPAEQPIEAPKTADPGVALYAALSLLSLTGLTCATKKR